MREREQYLSSAIFLWADFFHYFFIIKSFHQHVWSMLKCKADLLFSSTAVSFLIDFSFLDSFSVLDVSHTCRWGLMSCCCWRVKWNPLNEDDKMLWNIQASEFFSFCGYGVCAHSERWGKWISHTAQRNEARQNESALFLWYENSVSPCDCGPGF